MNSSVRSSRIRIGKGLDIPLAGKPEQQVSDARAATHVALLGTDYTGLQPRLHVEPGDRVSLGQTLFTDKRNERVRFTAPGAGEVVAVNRGARRKLQSVVVRLEGDDEIEFGGGRDAAGIEAEALRDLLLESGLWTAFRTRPYGKVPDPGRQPDALFVTAIDTRPLAADPAVIIGMRERAFRRGIECLLKLARCHVYVCTAPGVRLPLPDDERLAQVEFQGPHPAGLPGTHIHCLFPVSESRVAWHLAYQDVIAFGQLLASGRLPTERVVSLAGPMARQPRLVRTRLGARTDEIVAGECSEGMIRVVSGSPLSGHRAAGPLAFLGRYHDQVSIIREDNDREFLSWARPGPGKYSSERAFAGHLSPGREYALTTSQHGSPRALVPVGSFERVMPLDILPTPLIKALLIEDSDRAKGLGCLELDEEDLSLCSFVCNGKYEYGAYLRRTLEDIEANG